MPHTIRDIQAKARCLLKMHIHGDTHQVLSEIDLFLDELVEFIVAQAIAETHTRTRKDPHP